MYCFKYPRAGSSGLPFPSLPQCPGSNYTTFSSSYLFSGIRAPGIVGHPSCNKEQCQKMFPSSFNPTNNGQPMCNYETRPIVYTVQSPIKDEWTGFIMPCIVSEDGDLSGCAVPGNTIIHSEDTGTSLREWLGEHCTLKQDENNYQLVCRT